MLQGSASTTVPPQVREVCPDETSQDLVTVFNVVLVDYVHLICTDIIQEDLKGVYFFLVNAVRDSTVRGNLKKFEVPRLQSSTVGTCRSSDGSQVVLWGRSWRLRIEVRHPSPGRLRCTPH